MKMVQVFEDSEGTYIVKKLKEDYHNIGAVPLFKERHARITKKALTEFMEWYLAHEDLHDKSNAYIAYAYRLATGGKYVSREAIRLNRNAPWVRVKGKLIKLKDNEELVK